MAVFVACLIVAAFFPGIFIECKRPVEDLSSVEIIEPSDVEKEEYGIIENGAAIISQKLPNAVMVETSNELIRRLNALWKNRNWNFEMSDTILATFDSRGLQNRVLYRNSTRFFQAIQNLEIPREENEYPATFHAIKDLLEKDLTDSSSVLVITKSKASDKDFGGSLSQKLAARKSQLQLSVLWAGDKNLSEYGPLLEMTRMTGGKFEFLSDGRENKSEKMKEQKDVEQIGAAKSDSDWLNRIRFPEDAIQANINSILTLRAGNERFAGNFYFPLIVEVASGAILEVRPGTPTRIPFTVKNNLNSGVNVVFGAKYKNMAQFIQPERAFLPPLASITVFVQIQENPNRPVHANSTVVFSAFLPNKIVSRAAIVSLVPLVTYDKTVPGIYYKYGGDCTDFKKPQDCEKGFWGVEVTAQDEESGILKLVSEPYGLLFSPDFIAGTKGPVTAYYSASCCQPKVDIWAEDLNGNYAQKSLDVFNQTLLAGEIAAIVVGIILLLFVLIAICVIVALVKRRNRRNLVIPRGRADSR